MVSNIYTLSRLNIVNCMVLIPQVVREALPSFKQCSAQDPNQLIERKYDTYLPDGLDTEVDKDSIIKGLPL